MNGSPEVCVGYLLLRPVPRSPYMSASLLPPEIVSASACICPQFPDTSAIDWVKATDETRFEALDAVGLPADRRDEARAWATAEFERTFGWPGVFYTAEGALTVRRQLFDGQSNVKVIGLALPASCLAEFLAYASPPPPAPGFAPQGESGYVATAKRHEAPAKDARRLGYELLNVESGQLGHSWLCNGLETHCEKVLQVRPGTNGLFETLEDAERCRHEISREEVGAEPGLWLPWLLMEYS